MTITKSPQGRFGVKVGLCLPRKICAICDARRPNTSPSASMTYHLGCRSAAFALYVFIISSNSYFIQPVVCELVCTHLAGRKRKFFRIVNPYQTQPMRGGR